MKAGQKAQMSQADGVTPAERKDGLVCIMVDFHAQMALLRLIYKLLYDTKSSGDIGTLHACKNVISSGHSLQMSEKTYKCSELVKNVISAYIITGKFFINESLV